MAGKKNQEKYIVVGHHTGEGSVFDTKEELNEELRHILSDNNETLEDVMVFKGTELNVKMTFEIED